MKNFHRKQSQFLIENYGSLYEMEFMVHSNLYVKSGRKFQHVRRTNNEDRAVDVSL